MSYEQKRWLRAIVYVGACVLIGALLTDFAKADDIDRAVCRVGVEGKECNGKSCSIRTYYGSGSLIAPGRVLTCAHLWDEGKEHEPAHVVFNGQRFPAKLIKYDRRYDLALLAVPNPIRVVAEGGNHPRVYTVRPTEYVDQIDENSEFILTGFGSGTYKRVTARFTDYYQQRGVLTYEFSAPGVNGDSGGGVFNRQGQLVGVRWGSDFTTFTMATGGRPLVEFLWGQ